MFGRLAQVVHTLRQMPGRYSAVALAATVMYPGYKHEP
jgi:hypothetical protein